MSEAKVQEIGALIAELCIAGEAALEKAQQHKALNIDVCNIYNVLAQLGDLQAAWTVTQRCWSGSMPEKEMVKERMATDDIDALDKSIEALRFKLQREYPERWGDLPLSQKLIKLNHELQKFLTDQIEPFRSSNRPVAALPALTASEASGNISAVSLKRHTSENYTAQSGGKETSFGGSSLSEEGEKERDLYRQLGKEEILHGSRDHTASTSRTSLWARTKSMLGLSRNR